MDADPSRGYSSVEQVSFYVNSNHFATHYEILKIIVSYRFMPRASRKTLRDLMVTDTPTLETTTI